MTYQRFVALGDSCAEGLDDRYPDSDLYRGWADLVAGRLSESTADFQYANLAVRGRRLDQIAGEQVPAVAALEPDLVALFGGANDLMTTRFDAAEVAARVDRTVAALTAIAPTVVLFTVGDISRGVPFVRAMRPRLDVLNAAIRRAAGRYGAVLVDLWALETDYDLRYFGADRLHLSLEGHRRVAAHVLGALGASADDQWLAPLTGEPLRVDISAQARWLWREVLPVAISRVRNVVVRRSPGDGFSAKRPDLAPVLAVDRLAV